MVITEVKHIPHLTRLFRNYKHWEVVREILRQRDSNRQYKAWSAGCSYGAEAYSLAVLLADIAPNYQHVVIGTDNEQHAIDSAKSGKFNNEEADEIMPDYVNGHWYEDVSGGIEITPFWKERVTFFCNDLIKDPPTDTGFDIIACRNVIGYYDENICQNIIAKLKSALRADGILFIGNHDGKEVIDLLEQFGFQKIYDLLFLSPM